MKDTPSAVQHRFNQLLLSVPPAERLAMSCRMFAAARGLVRCGIVHASVLTKTEVRKQIFLRFYGKDFSDTERAKILSRIATS